MKIKNAIVAAVAAGMLVLSAAPAPAATVETCHPPRYDTVACVCEAAARLLTKITGDPWYCAG